MFPIFKVFSRTQSQRIELRGEKRGIFTFVPPCPPCSNQAFDFKL